MVLLTMTTPMVEALEKTQSLGIKNVPSIKHSDLLQGSNEAQEQGHEMDKKVIGEPQDPSKPPTTNPQESMVAEPVLQDPKIGNPISHGQVVDLSKHMKDLGLEPCRLETLLKGSTIYVPPPPAKPDHTSEYKALMARLRAEEEARSYERMLNPPPPPETFAQRFPNASMAHAFPSSYQSIQTSDPDDDGTTYADVDRQITLIFNVLISIVACAAAIWVTARWWSTPMRLALSMSGSLLVGVAEVVVYAGYIRRVGEAKAVEKRKKEVKTIVNTWVVGGDEKVDDPVMLVPKEESEDVKARRRKKDIS